MFNRSEIMKDAHVGAKHMMRSQGWAQHGYRYCFQYALQGAWRRAKVEQLTKNQRRVVEIKDEIAGLEYLPFAQNASKRRDTLNSQLSLLEAA